MQAAYSEVDEITFGCIQGQSIQDTPPRQCIQIFLKCDSIKKGKNGSVNVQVIREKQIVALQKPSQVINEYIE